MRACARSFVCVCWPNYKNPLPFQQLFFILENHFFYSKKKTNYRAIAETVPPRIPLCKCKAIKSMNQLVDDRKLISSCSNNQVILTNRNT